MRNICSIVACIIIAVMTFGGCTSSDTQGASDADVVFKRVKRACVNKFIDSKEEYGFKEDLTFGESVELILPQILYGVDVASLRDSICALAFDSVGADFEGVVDAVLKTKNESYGYELENITSEYTDSLGNVDIHRCDEIYAIEGSVAYMSQSYLCYSLNTYYMPAGAAHSMYTTYYINYDIKSGKVLHLTDIFTPEGLEALPAIIAKHARAMVDELGTTIITSLPDAGNFYLTSSSKIIFVYQPYEVASFGQGIIRVPIKMYYLDKYLTELGSKLY